jgi:hypothetical protein
MEVKIVQMDDQAAGHTFLHKCITAGPVMHIQTK